LANQEKKVQEQAQAVQQQNVLADARCVAFSIGICLFNPWKYSSSILFSFFTNILTFTHVQTRYARMILTISDMVHCREEALENRERALVKQETGLLERDQMVHELQEALWYGTAGPC